MAKRASKKAADGKLAQLKAKHFTPEGREERIARALEILNLPGRVLTQIRKRGFGLLKTPTSRTYRMPVDRLPNLPKAEPTFS
jgi:hypothetical protein